MNREKWKTEYRTRFETCEEELRARYMDLYHGDEAAWDYFTGMLYRMWEERPEKLKVTDAVRESCPEWYRGHEMVGMQLYVLGILTSLAVSDIGHVTTWNEME